MAARNAPRTIQALAGMELKSRSDYATWCQGFDNICDQLALLVLAVEDELFRRLASASGGGMTQRVKARRATRPLRTLATAVRATGRMAPRAYRIYAKIYAEEINPQRRKQSFDHEPSKSGGTSG